MLVNFRSLEYYCIGTLLSVTFMVSILRFSVVSKRISKI